MAAASAFTARAAVLPVGSYSGAWYGGYGTRAAACEGGRSPPAPPTEPPPAANTCSYADSVGAGAAVWAAGRRLPTCGDSAFPTLVRCHSRVQTTGPVTLAIHIPRCATGYEPGAHQHCPFLRFRFWLKRVRKCLGETGSRPYPVSRPRRCGRPPRRGPNARGWYTAHVPVVQPWCL